MPRWSVYLVRCGNGSLYTGIATDVTRRFAEHRAGAGRGAKYLRGRGPLRLVFERAIGSRALALRVERRIKRLPRALKEELIASPGRIEAMVARARKQGLASRDRAEYVTRYTGKEVVQ